MSWLSSGIKGMISGGGLFTDIAGGFLGNMFGQNQQKNTFEYLLSKGLTPWEIGGNSAGQGSAGGNTLGNGSNTQQMRQQRFQMQERAKDRAVDIEKAKIGAGAAMGQLQLTKERQPHEIGLTQMKERKLAIEYDKMSFELKNAWALLLAKMSKENVVAALLMSSEGVNAERVLKQIKGTPAEKAAVERAINRIIGAGGHTQREWRGIATIAGEQIKRSGEYGTRKGQEHGRTLNEMTRGVHNTLGDRVRARRWRKPGATDARRNY